MPNAPSRGSGRLVLMIWVLVAIFYYYLASDYIRVTMNDKTFNDYVDYVVQIAGREHRPAKEIRTLILVKADELRLPVKGERIVVLGGGETLNVTVDYDVEIEFPGVERVLFRKSFQHKGQFH